MTPTVLTSGTICLISSRCESTGSMSLTPVTLASGASTFFTRPAPTGSVTAVKTIGVVWSALTTACDVGVAIPKIRSRPSPANFWAMLAAVAMSPCAFWSS